MNSSEEKKLWNEFTRTGKIGVYLCYRAMLAARQGDHS